METRSSSSCFQKYAHVYSPVGLQVYGLFSRISSSVSLAAVIKSGASNKCICSFLGDIGELEQGKGSVPRWCPQTAFLERSSVICTGCVLNLKPSSVCYLHSALGFAACQEPSFNSCSPLCLRNASPLATRARQSRSIPWRAASKTGVILLKTRADGALKDSTHPLKGLGNITLSR